MNRLIATLKDGSWVSADRRRGYSLILLAFTIAAVIGWIALADGNIDRNGKPLGTDFSNPYAAGVLALEGRAADAYDPPKLHDAEKAVFGGRDVPFYGWHYPPFFFAVAVIVASLPYLVALFLWQGLSLAAFLGTVHAIVPRREALLAAAAFPAVFVNLGHGQNGFLTAALLGGGLFWLHRRPWLAGMLIGLLAYKPQFGLLIPLALLAGGHWRAIVAAGGTVIALVAVSTLVLGVDIWHAFAESTTFTQAVILEQGATGWEKIQSVFSAVRNFGGGLGLAYTAQGALALALAASLVWLWRSEAAFDLKASALATACLLATPYVLDYDLVVLGVAIAFFVRDGVKRGFGDYEISLLAVGWFVPLIARSVMSGTGLPLGLVTMLALYAITLWRAALDRKAATRTGAAIAQA